MKLPHQKRFLSINHLSIKTDIQILRLTKSFKENREKRNFSLNVINKSIIVKEVKKLNSRKISRCSDISTKIIRHSQIENFILIVNPTSKA